MMLDVDSDGGPLPDVEVGDDATIAETEADGPVQLNTHSGMPDTCHDGSDVSFESATPQND
jgi:hypothetical protein